MPLVVFGYPTKSTGMLKSYFKIAWRNLLKHKSFSIINITGLAIGMATVLLIWTWVQNELDYDGFYSHSKELYKLYNKASYQNSVSVWDVTSGPAGPALQQNYAEVAHTSRIYWPIERLFTYGDKHIKSTGNDVDASFLDMFDFPLISGSREHLLEDGKSIVLTETLAKKLFGGENPVGKTITLDNKEPYRITGVMKDLPANTDFSFTYLIPLTNISLNNYSNNWNSNSYYTYVELKPGTSVVSFNQKIRGFLKPYITDGNTSLFLYPMSKMHLYSRFDNGVPVGGKIEEVRLIVFIGLIVLLIACVNFMNLSTARSQRRAKEVGVRKVFGARRNNLLKQFLCESILLAFSAGVLAVLIVWVVLPLVDSVMGKPYVLNFADPFLWVGLVGFILVTGILAGIYPAVYLSAFKPVKVLKGTMHPVKQFFSPRKVLVVLQFSIAIILIVSTMIIYRQIQFVQNRNIGYNVANLIEVPVEGDIEKNYTAIKAALLNTGAVASVTRTGWGVTINGSTSSGFTWEGPVADKNNTVFSLARTESDLIQTLGLKLVAGRDLDYSRFPADSNAILLNESAVKTMGLKDPIGKIVTRGTANYVVTGVFKDFIVGSPYSAVGPMMVFTSKSWLLNMVLRLNENGNVQRNLQQAGDVLRNYNPAYPFTYHFVDQEYGEKFKDQQQTGMLMALFSALTIFISCLGMFGLASYMAEVRIREIGIRKVLGASGAQISGLFSREFVSLVVIAIFIATPIAWWIMAKWLNDFTYRVDISWVYFGLAGCGAIVLALITVSMQAMKAALANPVDSLRADR